MLGKLEPLTAGSMYGIDTQSVRRAKSRLFYLAYRRMRARRRSRKGGELSALSVPQRFYGIADLSSPRMNRGLQLLERPCRYKRALEQESELSESTVHG
jgi:hypothetical protein